MKCGFILAVYYDDIIYVKESGNNLSYVWIRMGDRYCGYDEDVGPIVVKEASFKDIDEIFGLNEVLYSELI